MTMQHDARLAAVPPRADAQDPGVDTTPMEAALRRAAVINATLLKLCALDLDTMNVETFHQQIDAEVAALERAKSAFAIKVAEKQIAMDVQHQMKVQQTALQSREAEYAKTVSLLTDAIVQFRDNSADFTSEVMERTTEMNRLVAIDDLRALRSQLAEQLVALQQSAEEKQQADAEQMAHLKRKVTTLEEQLVEAESRAGRDGLTGLANRAAWDGRLAELAPQLRDGQQSVALAMFDMDRFKYINDQHGHQAGDAVLSGFAGLCKRAFHNVGFIARYGGDEFAAILTVPNLEQAVERVNSLIQYVRDASINDREQEPISFTISAGLAYARDRDTIESLLGRADKALYAAKQEGRDRLVIAA
jgi:diguanylate cyclase